MQGLHARYPFLDASREAVQQADVDLGRLVQEGGPAVERGRERVERALTAGTVEPQGRWGTRAELLSYPIARVIVSLVDIPGAVEKYARAEAGLAHDRFVEDIERGDGLKSDSTERITLRHLLADFDLSSAVTPVLTEAGEAPGRFDVDVAAYLSLSAALPGEEWRLVARPLTDGQVAVSRQELYTLLREAVRKRVMRGLPLSVPESIADALAGEVRALREQLADIDLPEVDEVSPAHFPPCVTALVQQAQEGWLSDHSRFSLLSFLASIGMGAPEVVALVGTEDLDEVEDIRYGMERLRDEHGAQFAPPSCATMQAYGDCVNRDERCETVAHPLSYYADALAAAEE
jgi:DNA primase large subunit